MPIIKNIIMKDKLFIIILIFLSSCSHTTTKQTNLNPETVSIKGRILNIEKHKVDRSIQFIFMDLINREQRNTFVSEIDSQGYFSLNIPLMYPQDFYLNFERLTNLFCVPGDTLIIEIDPDKFINVDNKIPGGQFPVRVTGGNRIKDNLDILSFMQEKPDKLYKNKYLDDAIKTKSSRDFSEYIKTRETEYRTFLNDFKKNKKTSEQFNRWADDYLKYESWNDLMAYPSYNARLNNIPKDSIKVSSEYYEFLNNYYMNDNHLISTKHADFLYWYNRYVLNNPKDSVDKAIQFYKKADILSGAKIQMRMILQNTSGFTNDLILTKFYLDAIEGQQLNEFEALYDSIYITDPFFKNLINYEYNKLQKFMSNQITEGANLGSLNSMIIKTLIDTICTKYSGKVIYIDFWAPWCSPCMAQLPYTKALQDDYKNKDVVFLFLANQCTEESWKATIANKKLTGEHILLSKDQYDVLVNEFGITGIPHYVLIDKNGNIVFRDAPRPSQNNLIKQLIDRLQ